MSPGVVVAGACILVLLVVAILYNNLVRVRNHCDEAWSDVQTELKRRYDLIPNLVNAVKGYARYERGLLETVTRLRQECVENTGSPGSQAASENKLVRALGALIARVENYPDLKASQNYLQLQQELVNTEDRIQASRRFYNGNVRENNNLVQSFPSNLVASAFGFKEREFFGLEDAAARNAPEVALN